MTTIHNRLLSCKRFNSISDDINEDIISKLVVLLYHVCNVDLSNDVMPFIQKKVSFVNEIHIEYKFKYGVAVVAAHNNMLEASFFFVIKDCKEIYVPFQSNHCDIDVDHNLNFNKATLNYLIHIVKTTLQTKMVSKTVGTVLVTNPSYGTVYFTRVIDKNHQLSTSISYKNHISKYDENGGHIDITPDELDQHYFQPSKEFEYFLVNIMRKYADKPQQFDSVFVDYPTYQDFMNNKQSAITFLNLLSEQYFNNFQLLENNLLVFDMQEI